MESPAHALAELVQGNARFVSGDLLHPRRELDHVRAHAETQEPFAAVLGCADSRVPIEIIFDQGFGDLFVVRVAGNLATPVEVASLEYAVVVLGVQVVMVLGHERCGAVQAALDDTAPGEIAMLHRYLVQYLVPGLDPATRDLGIAVRANVQFQVRTLRRSSPVLAARVEAGRVKLVGGVFDLMSGRVIMVED